MDYKLNMDKYKPDYVGFDLKTGDEFIRPSDGRIWTVVDSYPAAVRVRDEEGDIGDIDYTTIHQWKCIHTSPSKRESLYKEIIADLVAIAMVDRTTLE